MDAPCCRLLPFEAADGPANMAADEVLLEAAERGAASLRFYQWSVPTLSLGYFQPEAPRRSDPRLAGLPWVRRATGGGALVHHFEITYALALPPGVPWQRRGESWACRLHGVLRAALASLGVPSLSCGEGGEKGRGEFLCFLHQTPGDVLLGGHKVVGSAQRKRRGAVLQHGSLLLAVSPFTPSLPGIFDLSRIHLPSAAVRAAAVEHFGRETGWKLDENDWTGQERQRREELIAAKYATEAWNRRR
jgi:lipoate-protein ligase A